MPAWFLFNDFPNPLNERGAEAVRASRPFVTAEVPFVTSPFPNAHRARIFSPFGPPAATEANVNYTRK
jgi:hypothetical protein